MENLGEMEKEKHLVAGLVDWADEQLAGDRVEVQLPGEEARQDERQRVQQPAPPESEAASGCGEAADRCEQPIEQWAEQHSTHRGGPEVREARS